MDVFLDADMVLFSVYVWKFVPWKGIEVKEDCVVENT